MDDTLSSLSGVFGFGAGKREIILATSQTRLRPSAQAVVSLGHCKGGLLVWCVMGPAAVCVFSECVVCV